MQIIYLLQPLNEQLLVLKRKMVASLKSCYQNSLNTQKREPENALMCDKIDSFFCWNFFLNESILTNSQLVISQKVTLLLKMQIYVQVIRGCFSWPLDT